MSDISSDTFLSLQLRAKTRFFLDFAAERAKLRAMRSSVFRKTCEITVIAYAMHAGCIRAAECQRTDASCDPLAMYWLYYAPFVTAPCQGAGTALASYFTFVDGGSNNARDYALCATRDGGLLYGGAANANLPTYFGKTPVYAYGGGSDLFLAKLDANGDLDWYSYLGDSGGQSLRAVTETSDGAYVVAGVGSPVGGTLQGQSPLQSYSGNGDWFIARLSARGQLEWHTYLGDLANSDEVDAVVPAASGGVVLVGNLGETAAALVGRTPVHPFSGGGIDVCAVELSSSGAIVWHAYYGAAGGFQTVRSLVGAPDGGYILGGSSDVDIPSLAGRAPIDPFMVGGANAGLVLKLDASGVLQWYTFVGGVGDETIGAVSVAPSGDVFAAGTAQVNIPTLAGKTPLNASTGTEDFIVLRYSPAGVLRWYTFLGGANFDDATAMAYTKNGGVVVAGTAAADIPTLAGKTPLNPYAGGTDLLLTQLDGAGNLEWYSLLPADGSGEIVASRNGGFWLMGYANASIASLFGKTPALPYQGITDMLLLRFKADGVL